MSDPALLIVWILRFSGCFFFFLVTLVVDVVVGFNDLALFLRDATGVRED